LSVVHVDVKKKKSTSNSRDWIYFKGLYVKGNDLKALLRVENCGAYLAVHCSVYEGLQYAKRMGFRVDLSVVFTSGG
jgi:hypothetical protein